MSEPRIEQLVIDTNAIVHGMNLLHVAKEYYTCPEVIAELRSSHTREYMAQLPFEIDIREPTEEALKAVIAFSKKTGDFASLSLPDLKVLALAYTLEIQKNGTEHLRTEPVRAQPVGKLPTAPPKRVFLPPKEEPQVDEDGWEIATSKKKQHNNNNNNNKKKKQKQPVAAAEVTENLAKLTVNETPVAAAVVAPAPAPAPAPVSGTAASEEKADKAASAEDMGAPKVIPHDSTNDAPESEKEEKHQVGEVITIEEDDDDEDDESGWITPENVAEYKAAEMGVKAEELKQPTVMGVACMTGDFAMQNVLLQMNLNLVSTGGHRITKIKNWVLRCHACFTVTSNMEKKFCPKCGNASLQRVSCSTNSKGQVVYHLKKNFKYNLRGTKYDIPPPKGGRHVNNIVLREDQREYMKAQQRKPKQGILNMFDPDFVPLAGKTGLHLGRTATNMYGSDTIGFGRRNPNDTRKKRGLRK
ncbi:Nin one binding Zn-ribbon like-domain-containing protein [Dichotomocladium elegans]|nr:Nin one binding Zn-ribbon like-domain-containing protein [Dichotomocladium elegans]